MTPLKDGCLTALVFSISISAQVTWKRNGGGNGA